jgi:hypothetical protein
MIPQRDRDLQIARLYQGGMTPKQIEEKYGFSRGIVDAARRRVGVPPKANNLTKAKIEDRNIRILTAHDEGLETADIAQAFGISSNTVLGIIVRMKANRAALEQPPVEVMPPVVVRDPCFHCNVRGDLHSQLGCKNYAVAP